VLSDIRGNFELILNRLIFLMPSAADANKGVIELILF